VASLLKTAGLTQFPPRLVLIVIFLGLTEWLTMARIIRGRCWSSRSRRSSRPRSRWAIAFAHPLAAPASNLSGIIIVYLTLTIPAIMLDESFMSFLVWASRRRWRAGVRCLRCGFTHQPDQALLVDAHFPRRIHDAHAAGLNFSATACVMRLIPCEEIDFMGQGP